MNPFSGAHLDIRSKLPGVGTTIFTVMSKLAQEENAINLSQGFPDFPPPRPLINLVSSYMRKAENQYAPMPGLMELRTILAEKIAKSYDFHPNPEHEITITAGATQALFTAINALIREGDEVIVIEPAYDSYIPAIKLAGGVPVYVELKAPEFKIPWEEVKNKLSFRTRMIIINSPQNPTGTIIDENDLEQLKIITNNTNILILSDEVYEHLTFDGNEHLSVLQYPELYERSIATFSFGKVFHATGWKIGYCVAPPYLTKEIRRVHQFNVFSVNRPVQRALAEFLKEEEHYLSLPDFFQQKRDFFASAMEGSRFKLLPSAGTYFQLADYSAISEEGDLDFAERMTKEFKVASIPISVFYHNKIDQKIVRFCFAKSEKLLEKAAKKLCKV